MKFKRPNIIIPKRGKFKMFKQRVKIYKIVVVTSLQFPNSININKSIVKSPSSNLKLALTPSSTHPQHHLYHHLLPCNESHNHRQSQIERVS